MWLEIIEPDGVRVVRLEIPVSGEEWEHIIKHPVYIRPKTIRITKDRVDKSKDKEKNVGG